MRVHLRMCGYVFAFMQRHACVWWNITVIMVSVAISMHLFATVAWLIMREFG